MPVETVELDGRWELLGVPHAPEPTLGFAQPGLDTRDWIAVSVPGDIHRALEEAKRIPAPYFGLNARACRWTVEHDWWYRREFAVSQSRRGTRIELVFDGIDTYSTVYLNGARVGQTDNMFRQYRFDVTEHIRFGEPNTVAVCIGATIPILERRDTIKYFACFYAPRIFARKAQCHFSWDWAPDLPALGIWQSVRLEARQPGCIEDVCVRTRTSGDAMFHVVLDPSVRKRHSPSENEPTWASPLLLTVEILDGDAKVVGKTVTVSGQKNFVDLTIPEPRLWWPNGYGEAFLYHYRVLLSVGGDLLHEVKGRFGLREVQLVQEPMSDDRRSFRFRINGEDVFCMGANWVPADCFPGTVEEERYAHLLRLARDARFNMLRVWGGGIYEKDAFYNLCDELGIMVWQDFMFACSDIPDDDANFAMGLIPEFEYQVRRLRNHPSIVLLCGGNEKTGWCGEQKHHGETVTRFLACGVSGDMMPDVPYVPCSPYSLTDVGNDLTSGDSHKNVWEDAFAGGISRFRQQIDTITPVFASEFGLFSPPPLRSIRKFVPEDLLWPLNEVWVEHVRDNPYSSLSQTYLDVQEQCGTELFHEPTSAAEFIKVAGTFHAEILKAEFEHHRRRQPDNAGALIWMLNDCWTCGSWALVDYHGLPKQAYYAVKRASAPTVGSFRKTPGGFDLYVTTDSPRPLRGTVTIALREMDGSCRPLEKCSVDVPARGSRVVARVAAACVPQTPGAYLHVVITHQEGATAFTYFPNLWKDVPWPDPGLSMATGPVTKEDGEFRVRVALTAKHYARCVHITTHEDIAAHFSDNYFDMVPGETKQVTICSPHAFDAERLRLNHWLTSWE